MSCAELTCFAAWPACVAEHISSMQITESGADTGILVLVNADIPEQHAPQSQHGSYVDSAALINALHCSSCTMHATSCLDDSLTCLDHKGELAAL